MRLVREHINEEFSEQGDPVQDMGIGPEGMIEEYKKKVIKEKGWTRGQTLNDLTTATELVQDMSSSGWRDRERTLSDDEFENYKMMFEYLLKKGSVDVNAPNTYMLSSVISLKHPKPRRLELLKLLIKYGLKIKSLENEMHHYDDPGQIEVLKILVKAGILQRKEKFVQTFKNNVLFWAAKANNAELIKFAMEQGADASNRNYLAFQTALEKDNAELIKMFMKILQNDPKYK